MKIKIGLLASILLLGLPGGVRAEEQQAKNNEQVLRSSPAETKDQRQFRSRIASAVDVYRSIAKGPHGEVPVSILNNAQCIAVLPGVVTGAIVLGGTHGKGFVSCKNKGAWSTPAAISLTQGSIGLQAGAKSTDLVLFFQTNGAVQALKRGSFSMGADVGAVAGSYDHTAEIGNAGVVVYTRTAGLYAGASVSGSIIGKDQVANAHNYTKRTEFRDILEGRATADQKESAETLTALFPVA